MMDVRQLVDDQQLQVVVEIGEVDRVGGRTDECHDPVRRPHRGGGVGHVGMVGDDDVDRSAWRVQELRVQVGARLLRQRGGAPPEHFKMRGKGDAEMRRLDRAPVFVGRWLRPGQCRRRGQQAGRQGDAAGVSGYSDASHSRMVGVTTSGTWVCGPWPTPGSTWIVSLPSTHCHIPSSVPFVNGPLSLP